MRRERLLVLSKDILNEFRKSPFKLFIRANTFETVGIMTKITHKYDSGWGSMRSWALGLTFDNPPKRLEEPLDRKNKRTGELEDLIQMQTDMILITARNTSNPDDDDDENFQYLVGPHASNRLKDTNDRLKERERIIQDLQKKLDEADNQRDYFQREAEASGSEIRMLKSKVTLLTEKVANVEQQASHYRTELKKSHISNLEQEGAIDETWKDARGKGAFNVKDSADVVVDAAKKQVEAKRHLVQLGVGEIAPEYATKIDLDELEKKIMFGIQNVVQNIKQQQQQQPPAPRYERPPSPPPLPKEPEEE